MVQPRAQTAADVPVGPLGRIVEIGGDLLMMVGIALGVPFVILAIGIPFALGLRLLLWLVGVAQ